MATKLSPPQIASKLPAFYTNFNNETVLDVAFNITRAVSPADFKAIRVMLKTVQNNKIMIDKDFTTMYKDTKTGEYHVRVNITPIENQFPLIGQYYKVQLALVSQGDIVGYYSGVGITKYTVEPEVFIKELQEDNQQHVYTYTGVCRHTNDITEKVYSYCFNLYNYRNELIATSGEFIHDNSKDESVDQSADTWTVHTNLDSNVQYQIEYVITTINGVKKSSPRYIIIESSTTAPNIHATLHSTNHFDDGYIVSKIIGDKSGKKVNGRFILMRSSSEDNFDSWYELTRFDLTNWDTKTELIICKDYTVQQGVKYRYAVRAYNSVGLFSDRLLNVEGEVQADFEDAFLYDGERQLKIRFNPKVSSFKSTILETKVDTLGGQYPFIFRNGSVSYKEFPISGMISLLGDENNEFLSNLPSTPDFVREDFGHGLTADNFRKEREFKMLVLSWLTNGKPKLFRSPAEGNFIVYLMNTSLSPNDTLSRMLHTFSSTAYEIADCNFENLKLYGFASDDYTETRSLAICHLDLQSLLEADGYIQFEKPVAYLSIIAEPNSLFEYTLAGGASATGTVEIGLTGTYIFSTSALFATPMIDLKLVRGTWGSAGSLTYGWYDLSADNFSVVRNITTTDEITQLIGKGISYNLVNDLQDIRRKTGAFHYLKVEPREIRKIFKIDNSGNYYWNNNYEVVNKTALNVNMLYYIQEGFNDNAPMNNYIDGAEMGAIERPISSLNFNFKVNGMNDGAVVDFNGRFNLDDATTGRYEALTNLSSVSKITCGNGIILNLVYQARAISYIVEDPEDNVYGNPLVIQNKNHWLEMKNLYDRGLIDKHAVDSAYEVFVLTLTDALDNLSSYWEDVEYAL